MTNPSINKKTLLETDSFVILAVKKNEIKPFMNIFQIEGQNIQQQKSGKIFGIIQIDDNSKNSEYLPNLLTQILKKEYFKNKNKKCSESFEIALHKLNLALTELTQHEIVEWINNINAVFGVICNNKINFTQIGKGCLVFLKDNKITKIKSDNNNIEECHPMKTFSSISTGKLKNDDKIIFTIEKTFETVPENELERHYKTFDSNEFDNIFSSTLRNEASETGAVIVNIKSQENAILKNPVTQTKKEEIEEVNFFGKIKNKKHTPKPNIDKVKEKNIASPSDKNIKKKNLDESPFEHEPEIFIKEKDNNQPEQSTIGKSEKLNLIKNNLFVYFEKIKKLLKKQSDKHSIKKIAFNEVNIKKISNKKNYTINNKKLLTLKNWLGDKFNKIDIKKILKNFLEYLKKYYYITSKEFQRISKNLKFLNKKNNSSNFIEKVEDKIDLRFTKNQINLKAKNQFILKKIKKLKIEAISNFNSILKEKSKRKMFLIILISLLIFIVILIIATKRKNSEIKSFENIEKNLNQTISKENSTSSTINLRSLINLDKDIKESTFLNNNLFLLTNENSLIKFSIRDNKKTEILLPEDFKDPQYLTSIESLKLIFIINSEKVYSYSPTTNSFSRNTINIPENSEIIGAGTYLTYLYLLDKNFNQVYRYHRTPGGFGSYKNWLLEIYDLELATNLSVSDSVYITFENGKINKYFQGKKELEINIEKDFTPNKVRTEIDKKEIFIFDQKQGKIIQLLENGQQQEIYQDKQFKKANDFSVDFENKKIFVITDENKLLVFDTISN